MKSLTVFTLILAMLLAWLPMTAQARAHSPQPSQQPELLQSNQHGGIMSKARIVYPPKAQLEGVEGWVELQIKVDEAGNISAIEVIDAKPPRVFEDAAMESVANWTFQQKLVDGEAKPYQLSQKVEFELINYKSDTGQFEKD